MLLLIGKRLFIPALLTITVTAVFAQGAYRVERQTVNVSGRTKTQALERRIGNATGREFTSREGVEAFAEGLRRKVNNLRSFKKSTVTVVYGNDDAEGTARSPDRPIPVTIEISVTDGSAFVPIPYAFYNSNEGVMAGLIANAPNVAGSLENLLVMGLYSAPPDQNDMLQWADPNFMTIASWSGIPVGPTEVSLTGTVMKMNRKLERFGVLTGEFNEFMVGLSAKGKCPFTETFSAVGTVRAEKGLSSTISYVNDPSMLAYGPMDGRVIVKGGLLWDTVDWHGNFRSGVKAEPSASWTLSVPTYTAMRGEALFETEATAFALLGERINPSARVYAFALSDIPAADIAKRLRGIRNGEIWATEGVTLNAGTQILVAKGESVEFHLMPYADSGLFHIRKNAAVGEGEYRRFDWALSCGMEILLFFDSLKSLPIKVGFGYDLRGEEKNGSGKMYEVDFTFQTTY